MAYSDVILADSPLSYYRCDELSGTVSADASGNGYTGTYEGSPTLGSTDSIENTALVMDGVDDFITLPIDSAFELQVFSVEGWVKDVASNCAIWAYSPQGANIVALGAKLAVGPTNVFAIAGILGGATYESSITANVDLNDGDWHHIVATFNTTSGDVITYVDGVEETTGTLSGVIDWTPDLGESNPNYTGQLVGASPENNTQDLLFDGRLDEVAYYDAELTPTQVLAHFNAYIPPATFSSIHLGNGVSALPGQFMEVGTSSGSVIDPNLTGSLGTSSGNSEWWS